MVDSLLKAFDALRYNPPCILYRNVCQALAIEAYERHDQWATAFYLSEAQSITFRHNCIVNISRKIRYFHP